MFETIWIIIYLTIEFFISPSIFVWIQEKKKLAKFNNIYLTPTNDGLSAISMGKLY